MRSRVSDCRGRTGMGRGQTEWRREGKCTRRRIMRGRVSDCRGQTEWRWHEGVRGCRGRRREDRRRRWKVRHRIVCWKRIRPLSRECHVGRSKNRLLLRSRKERMMSRIPGGSSGGDGHNRPFLGNGLQRSKGHLMTRTRTKTKRRREKRWDRRRRGTGAQSHHRRRGGGRHRGGRRERGIGPGDVRCGDGRVSRRGRRNRRRWRRLPRRRRAM